MKTKIFSLFFLGLTLLLTSCEKEKIETVLSEPYVKFFRDANSIPRSGDQVFHHNFYYSDESVTRDTVWVKLQILAAIPQEDCHISCYAYVDTTSTQLEQNTVQAIEGKQFQAFDDPDVQSLMTFHKGNLYDSIPVILLRDASLKNNTYRITMRLQNSTNIIAADKTSDTDDLHSFVTIYVSDCLTRPGNWPTFLGTYGLVKHDFIIRHTGDRWDDAFISTIQSSQQTFYQYKFRNELADENVKRAQQGLSPLQEADGREVEFYVGYSY